MYHSSDLDDLMFLRYVYRYFTLRVPARHIGSGAGRETIVHAWRPG
jgi:hypothetical protein